jgi:hypothetical protein
MGVDQMVHMLGGGIQREREGDNRGGLDSAS